MRVRWMSAVASVALAVLTLPAVAHAGDVPDSVPDVVLTPTALVGGELDATMSCAWVDPTIDRETPIPTYTMVTPSGPTAAPISETGDAGTIFATWAATEAGTWTLYVTCGTTTQPFTAVVTAPEPTDPPATDPPATDPPTTTVPAETTTTTAGAPAPSTTVATTLPPTGGAATTAVLGAALFAAGGVAVVIARRRPHA